MTDRQSVILAAALGLMACLLVAASVVFDGPWWSRLSVGLLIAAGGLLWLRRLD